ncbi:hypothetical protein [Litorihabitans aurantiacus]|uniref:YjzC family protein n=1 Tax=Litorihabitans aurantiacus TaxID=1930061 RepID=A0AA37XG40_9MICO|nr:hypothetical protein [Litorihabitans aurantiacus]GMA32580.1 hypothetical protein GCM10025875_25720 [Litorihabitans aurantiacus]
MSKPRQYSPGSKAPYSGQYRIVGGSGAERTAVQNKPLPPTPRAGQRYVLVDRTKNGSGR